MSRNKKILFGLAIALFLVGAIAIANYKEPILGALKISKVGTEEEKIKGIQPNISAPSEESSATEEPIVPTEPVIISVTGSWSGFPPTCDMAAGADAVVIGKVKKVTMGCNKTARKNLIKAVNEAFGRIDDFETLYTEAIIEVERYLKNHSSTKITPEYFTEKEIAVRARGGKVGNVTFITEYYEPYNYRLPFEQNRKPFELNQRLILILHKNPKGYFVLYFGGGKGIIINDTVIGLPEAYHGMPLSEVLKIVEKCKYMAGPIFEVPSNITMPMEESGLVYPEYMPPMNKSETLASLKQSKKDFIEMGFNRTELEKLYRERLEGPPFDYNKTELERVLREILG